ncbi:DUF2059 domain-containing protein [Kiloniella sp.]|uniref:DUF2059 domain-containing protein n=1 Tax=Kiloniella sp. TaxID=1938587 RepID=UPI003B016EC3
MKKLFVLIILISNVYVLNVRADELTPEKTAVIDELLVLSNAEQAGVLMGKAIVQSMYSGIQEVNPNLDPKVLSILEEVVFELIDEDKDNGEFKRQLHEIYSKHFTTNELRDIVAFYKTPTGQKTVTAMPLIIQDSMKINQGKAQQIMPRIMQKLAARFKEEGIDL